MSASSELEPHPSRSRLGFLYSLVPGAFCSGTAAPVPFPAPVLAVRAPSYRGRPGVVPRAVTGGVTTG